MAILVVFSKWPLPKIQKYITLLVIDYTIKFGVKIYILNVKKSNGDVFKLI